MVICVNRAEMNRAVTRFQAKRIIYLYTREEKRKKSDSILSSSIVPHEYNNKDQNCKPFNNQASISLRPFV